MLWHYINIEKLFLDKKNLEKELNFFLTKKQIKKISKNKWLVNSHIKKARHNLKFYQLNKSQKEFKDWLIVALYYSLYCCALALITNKEFTSKNHYATILILLKEYYVTKDEANLIKDISINKNDAELYTNLKDDGYNASYVTNTNFTEEKISLLRR